jgi:hypothetical protein
MQITLVCPTNIPSCQNQTTLGNYPTGNWSHRFHGLIKGLIYTVYITAIDAAANTTDFPVFFLAYSVVTPTQSATITTTPSLPSPSLSPSVTPEIIVPFTPVPPPIPTPPVFQSATLVTPKIYFSNWIFILLVLGLPLHLLLTLYGAKIRFYLIPQFLFILFFPFVGKKYYQTRSFTTLDMYDPDKLDKPWQTKIADIKGYFSLSSPLLPKIFTKLSCVNHYWKNIIIDGNILTTSCLFSLPSDTTNIPNRLHLSAMTLRSLPLIIACLTSSFALYHSPNYFYLIYLYLSLHLVFTEYFYPRISK